jgi:hypothetical protein
MLLCAAAAMSLTVEASAEVSVRFVAPEHYRVASHFAAGALDRVQAELTRFLQRLGDRSLRPGERLVIEVLDLDLAGELEPWRRPGFADVRVLRDVTPPRIRLRYRLAQGAGRGASREETLTDVNYLMNPEARFSGDPLFYEKALLAAWFKLRFAGR